MKRTHDDSEPELPRPRRQKKEAKPRASPSPSPKPSDVEMHEKPKPKKKASAGAGGRKWTAAEYTALLQHALPKVPMKAWEGVLPDRTALQCDRAFK